MLWPFLRVIIAFLNPETLTFFPLVILTLFCLLIILDKASKEKIEKSARNIPNVKVTDVNHFSSYDIIKFKKVVFTESSVKELEKRYSKNG